MQCIQQLATFPPVGKTDNTIVHVNVAADLSLILTHSPAAEEV